MAMRIWNMEHGCEYGKNHLFGGKKIYIYLITVKVVVQRFWTLRLGAVLEYLQEYFRIFAEAPIRHFFDPIALEV